MMVTDIELRQSKLIEMMRYPLIVLVVFIHVIPEFLYPVKIEGSYFAMYRFFSELISHNVGRIAVPCFFFFSGYLFFCKLDGMDFGTYKKQIKKRMRTLMLPYILWNEFLILAIIIKNHIGEFLGLKNDVFMSQVQDQSLLALFWEGPINFPLWYIRDLICMALIAPFFYVLYRYTRVYGLAALGILYLSATDFRIPGFSTTALLFFGTGAYLGIYKKNFLEVCIHLRTPSMVIAFLSLCLAMYHNGDSYHECLIRIFVITGGMTAINLTDILMDVKAFRRTLCHLSQTVFFIYAIHEIYIINCLKGSFSRTSLADCGVGMLSGYIFIPVLTLCICIGLYFFLKKTMPWLLAVLIGGRNLKLEGGK